MDVEELATIVEQQRALQAARQHAAEAAGGVMDPIVGRWVPYKLLATTGADRPHPNPLPEGEGTGRDLPARQSLLFDLQVWEPAGLGSSP